MRHTPTILITLFFASATFQQQQQVKGCLLWDSNKGTCRLCYRRQIGTKGWGPLLPVTDTCLIHTEQAGQKTQCVLCRPGYGVTTQGQCALLGIFNCIDGAYTGPIHAQKPACRDCGNGQYPTAEGTCAPLATGGIANCLWGGRRGLNSFLCIRCNPGYVLADGNFSCVAVTAATTGCWVLKDGGKTCGICDALAGYSMQKNGRCKFIKKE